jgi:hypothetical protein
MSIARLLAACCAAAAVFLTGCTDLCHDACAREVACNDKLGINGPGLDTCTTTCQKDTNCKNKQANLSCRAALTCENSTTYFLDELACAGKCST